MTSSRATPLTLWGAEWMIRLRWIAAGAIALAPALARAVGFPLSVAPLLVIAALIAIGNALIHRRLRRSRARSEGLIHFQMGADLLALTGVLWATGGVRNPLLPAYGFHVVISAIILSQRASFAYAAAATGLAAVLALAGRMPLVPELASGPRADFVTLLALAGVLFTLAYLASVVSAMLRQRESRLVELTRTLAEQDQRKSQYVLRLGHGMLSRVEDIERAVGAAVRELPPGASESARGMLARARAWLEALHALIRDVVDLSRIRATGELDFSYVYLPRIIHQEAQNLKTLAQDRGVAIRIENGSAVSLIRVNAKALAQVVENLLRNAIAYSPKGSTVQVTLAEAEGALELRVEDQGMGIAAEDRAHLFEEFYRGARARELQPAGTGLGLAIVKQVVEQHGGQVTVESEEGRGSRFVVRLPATTERGESAEPEPPPAFQSREPLKADEGIPNNDVAE